MAQAVPLVQRIMASSVCVATRAGKIIRDIMAQGDLGIVEKGKNDLQTQADRSAQALILASLHKQFPKITIIGEEGDKDDTDVKPEWIITEQDADVLALKLPKELVNVSEDEICVWVDPLDGTSEYTQGLLDHVTVLIGIAVGSEAVGGVIHQPYFNYKVEPNVNGRTIWGLKGAGVGGFVPKTPTEGRIIATTRSHSDGLVNNAVEATQPSHVLRVGGAGHKVMLLMEGAAHAYVFASPGSKRWDTCAPEAILREMGGELTDMLGQKYDYRNTTKPSNSRGVLGTAIKSDHQLFVQQVEPVVKGKLV